MCKLSFIRTHFFSLVSHTTQVLIYILCIFPNKGQVYWWNKKNPPKWHKRILWELTFFSRLFWNKNVIFFSFSVILNIPLFEFRILHIFHLFQLLVLKRPQTKFKIHHVQAIYPSVSSINESKELFWKSRNSPFCCWYVSGDQKWIFIADTDVAAVVKTRFF